MTKRVVLSVLFGGVLTSVLAMGAIVFAWDGSFISVLWWQHPSCNYALGLEGASNPKQIVEDFERALGKPVVGMGGLPFSYYRDCRVISTGFNHLRPACSDKSHLGAVALASDWAIWSLVLWTLFGIRQDVRPPGAQD